MKTIYLAGGITGLSDEEVFGWRHHLIKHYNQPYKVVNFIDPTIKDYRGKEHNYVKEIVEFDKDRIDSADALIVNYKHGNGRPFIGTSMEMLYAWDRHKFIALVFDESLTPMVPVSPWLVYHTHVIYKHRSEYEGWKSEAAALRAAVDYIVMNKDI